MYKKIKDFIGWTFLLYAFAMAFGGIVSWLAELIDYIFPSPKD